MSQNSIAVNELLAPRWNKPISNISSETVGRVVLDSRGLFAEDKFYWIGIGAFIGFCVLFNVLYTVALTFLNPLGNSQAVISEDVIQDKQANRTGESNQGKKHHSVELTSQKTSSGFLPCEISQLVGRDIPGYLPRENPQLNDIIAHSMLRTHDPLGAPSETLRNGISPYGAGGLIASEISILGGSSRIGMGGLSGGVGPGGGSRIGLGRVAAGAGLLGLAPLNDPVLMGQRQGGVGIDPALARIDASLRLPDSAISGSSGSSFRLPDHLKPDESSNTIFIEGLPADCSRREVARILPKLFNFLAGGEPYVLCFVEFIDAKCALNAISALKECL